MTGRTSYPWITAFPFRFPEVHPACFAISSETLSSRTISTPPDFNRLFVSPREVSLYGLSDINRSPSIRLKTSVSDHLSVLRKRREARRMNPTAKAPWAATAGQRTASPTPLVNTPRRMVRYQRMGLSQVASRTDRGML